jgi:hypothetical protein
MRSLFQFIILLAVTFILTVIGAYAIRHNGLPDLLAQWMPSTFDPDYNKARPQDTLIAPFAEDTARRQKKAADDNALRIPFKPTQGESQDSMLNMPHRTKKEIGDWLVSKVSDIMNVTAEDYSQHMEKLKPIMTEFAIRDYDSFMRSSNILGTIHQENLKLQSYVEEEPLMLNSGEADERYHWLFEMPVTLSFLPKDMGDYRTIKGAKIPNEYVILKAQVGRMPNAAEEGVMIETWEVRRNRKDENKVSPAEHRAAIERKQAEQRRMEEGTPSDPNALSPNYIPGGVP